MNAAWLMVPFSLQGLALICDEGWYHRRRGLPRWERIGHPIDTALFGLCFVWLLARIPSESSLTVFVGLATLSCLLITKDEFVHARLCGPGESWLHALLFVLHPVVLGTAGLMWWRGSNDAYLALQLAAVCGIFIYQVGFWGPWNRKFFPSGQP